MKSRFPVVVLALLGVFAAGFASSHLLERNAQALTAPFASSVYVPVDGLAFRSFDGRVVARLSYNGRGGVFDVYDSAERPAVSLRSDMLVPPVSPGLAANCSPPFILDVVGTKHPKIECL